jgi:uncharacterized membrane protein
VSKSPVTTGEEWGLAMKKLLAIVIILIGVASMAIGIVFIAIGGSTDIWIRDQLKEEQITLGESDEQIAAGDVIDTSAEAQHAGDIVRSHRHEIAATYGDLTGANANGQFDATNTKDLTYAQAMNLENYLYLAVASFGLCDLAMGAGAGLVIVGIALILLAFMLGFWPKRWTSKTGSES